MYILDKISDTADIKDLSVCELYILCAEIRKFLIENVSQTGGHFASNLGVVELTVAIHKVFNTYNDRLVFDVGHQCYVHKILTGRKDGFAKLRKFGGLSGFPKPTESVHDAFIAGHASTSISAALGIARARTLNGSDFSVISVIGDGALTGGLAYEALSDAGASKEPLIIILNDNGMSITRNVGGISKHLSRLRIKPSYIAFKNIYKKFLSRLPGGGFIYKITHAVKTAVKEAILSCSMFEEMGLQYIGPVDGHDIKGLSEALFWAKQLKTPVVVHVNTKKGRGYKPAELNPEDYHGVKPFDSKIGVKESNEDTFSSVFGQQLTKLANENNKICAITASMTSGVGLTEFAKRYPARFFDVGIAEGHAVTMAAGMATQGLTPVFAVYSSFLQRSYDMILHDAAIESRHVVFAVDRSGLVAGDGETHQGVFDVSYLSTVPNMIILAPSGFSELGDMLSYAINEAKGPVAVRYPRGGEGEYRDGGAVKSKCLKAGNDVTVVTYGITVNTALEAARRLETVKISVEIVKLGFIHPIEYDIIFKSLNKTKRLIVIEESTGRGGVGERIAAEISSANLCAEKVVLMNTGEKFIPCGEMRDLRSFCKIDTDSLCAKIKEVVRNER